MSYADIRLAADDLQAAGLLMTDEHPRPERAPKPDRKAAPATRRAAAARSGAPRRAPARHKRKGEKK
jgi:hypothetical protein